MFDPWVGKIPCRWERLPMPVFWLREFHGLYSPWGRKELDTTEQLSLHFTLCRQKWASQVALVVKNPPPMQETQEMKVQSLGREDPMEEETATTPVIVPGKSPGQRRRAGYSPRGHRVGGD